MLVKQTCDQTPKKDRSDRKKSCISNFICKFLTIDFDEFLNDFMNSMNRKRDKTFLASLLLN